MRRLYVWLVNLHPRPFRERFGDEMIDTFDDAAADGSVLRLVVDGFGSLVRQWLLRPRPTPVRAAAGQSSAVAPLFQTLDSGLPGRSSLLNGAILSLMLLSLIVFGIGRNERFPRFLIGSQYPRPNVLPVDRNSIAEQEPDTEVIVNRPAADPLEEFIRQYFQMIRVLAILDSDRDHSLSPSEIATAPLILPRLDTDRDGSLNAAECGLDLGEGRVDERAARLARIAFMLGNPVLAALDRDRDTSISEDEARLAAESLRSLDGNFDGRLSAPELVPTVTAGQK